MKDTRKQLRRMLDFLEHPYTEERLNCVISHQIDTFRRKHVQEFDPFSPSQRQSLLQIMKTIEPLLNKYGTGYSDMYDFTKLQLK